LQDEQYCSNVVKDESELKLFQSLSFCVKGKSSTKEIALHVLNSNSKHLTTKFTLESNVTFHLKKKRTKK